MGDDTPQCRRSAISARINCAPPITTTPSQTRTAAILTYISGLWAGTEDPFWPHLILLSGSVLAGIAVGAGILYERPKYSEAVHGVATWLVIVGVAVESVCTICLFAIDERISGTQQSTIIGLDKEIAPRRLSDEQQKQLGQWLTPFAGKTARVSSYALDFEAAWLVVNDARDYTLGNFHRNAAALPADCNT
jgi:hypothetical protein